MLLDIIVLTAYVIILVMTLGGPFIGIYWYIKKRHAYWLQKQRIKDKARRQHLKKHGVDKGGNDGK